MTEAVAAAAHGLHDAARTVLGRAQADGRIRPDITIEEASSLVRALAHVAHEERAQRVGEIALDGPVARR